MDIRYFVRGFSMKTRLAAAFLMLAFLTSPAEAQRRGRGYPPRLPDAKTEVYKTVGDTKLKLYLFEPKGHRPDSATPAIVFFFGGGFVGGSPGQFQNQCRYFASRGMVAITADYRVRTRHGTTPADSIQDGKDALRYVRTHAKRLGIDPRRIVAAGGSAGGLIAACIGIIPTLDSESQPISYVPNALVLFNPAGMGETPIRRSGNNGKPLFTKAIMPYHHVRSGLPPMIMFYGEKDRFLEGARQFQDAAEKAGIRCDIVTWKDVGHGFFNYGRNRNREFAATLEATDRFLESLGYLEGEPTVSQFLRRIRRRSNDR